MLEMAISDTDMKLTACIVRIDASQGRASLSLSGLAVKRRWDTASDSETRPSLSLSFLFVIPAASCASAGSRATFMQLKVSDRSNAG